MKRIIALLLALFCLFGLVSCAGEAPSEPTSEVSSSAKQEEFAFTYKGISIAMHAAAAPLIEQLGEPKSYTESPSCAFSGLDKTYFYGSFYLSTYPVDGTDYVLAVWFADDSVATDKGIYIGSKKEDVIAAYGESDNGSSLVYTKDNSTLTFVLKDDVVSDILYDALFNE